MLDDVFNIFVLPLINNTLYVLSYPYQLTIKKLKCLLRFRIHRNY